MNPEDPDCPIDFELCLRDNKTCGDLAEPKSHLSIEQAAQQTIELRPVDMVATSNKEFAEQLLSLGCTPRRHAFAMTLDFSHLEIKPRDLGHQSVFIEDMQAHDLFDSWFAAYPPGHPDFLPGTKAELITENLQPLLDRSLLGANHRSSRAVLHDGRVIAAIIISLREGDAPYGGPWVSEIWCDPTFQHQGIGRTLLTNAITALAEDGFTSLGLAVSNGNAAISLYQSVGFEPVSESWTINLPEVP
ncbi:MAG: GNAT family N-acetyltransferase [Candidatus Nanopelagicales bacterium]|jgi:GNAT superfamily N-acetyltransferase